MGQDQPPPQDANSAIRQQISTLTWADPDHGRAVAEALLKEGAPAIQAVAAMLTPPADTGDADARFALEALALHVERNGAEADRRLVSDALAGALGTAADTDVKAFLIRRLQLVGKDEAVPALQPYLADKALCDPATEALVRIGTPAAAAALRAQLAKATDANRLALVKALGDLADTDAVALVRPYASDANRDLKLAAWTTLARTGDAELADTLFTALQGTSPYEADRARRTLVLLAHTLHNNGQTEQAVQICRKLAAAEHSLAQALSALVDIRGADAMPDLLAAVDRDNRTAREAALKLALEIPGPDATRAWIAKARRAAPDVKAAIVQMLGYRKDPLAWDAVNAALTDEDQSVRNAAITALARIDAQKAMPILIDTVATGTDADARSAAAVLRHLASDSLARSAAASLAQATPQGKQALIQLLAERNARTEGNAVYAVLADENNQVRKTALAALEGLAETSDVPRTLAFMLAAQAAADRKGAQNVLVALARRDPAVVKAVVAALADADDADTQSALLQTLARIGGPEALAAVTARTAGGDETVRDAAVRALASWPDAGAVAPLLEVIETTGNEVHRVLALRGLVRLAESASSGSTEKRVELLEQAMAKAKSTADRKLVLGGVGALRHPKTLAMAEKYLVDPELKEEAAAAIVAIVCPRDKKDQGMRSYEAYKALEKVVAASTNKALVEKAKQTMAALAPVVSTNVALGKPVSISCTQQGDHAPEGAVDGKLTRDTAYWGSAWPSWFQIDLQEVRKIDTVRIIFYWDGKRYYPYTLDVSTDGKTWTTVADNSKNSTPADSRGIIHQFDPVDARYVRVNIIKNSVNEAVHLVEVEVYAAGEAPKVFKSSEPPAPPPAPPLPKADADGFITLFNGKDLTGWIGSLKGYEVVDGVLRCRKQGGGKLLTAYRFSDFVLAFDFKLTEGANNGLAIRAPADGNPAYVGMELQIIDNPGYEKAHNYKLQPYQTHGSIYGVVPAKTGALKPVGEWNHQEVRAVGPNITVILNGQTIVDADLDTVTETADGKGLDAHPGLQRRNGHIGWLGHGADVDFKNIRIKPLEPYTTGPLNSPPEGFTALFNGKDLTGWKGLVANPEKRAQMTPEQLAAEQKKADERMHQHWNVVDDTIVFDGKGQSLCTAKDYGDFEMFVDWKIKPRGDSGIYLRGSPQVQIWDPAAHPEGSGGLYNNQKHPSKPTECMDNPVGQWNRFRIRMVGEKGTVWLNGQNVVDNVVMENYWNRSKPIYPTGQIELQNHGNTLYFRNIYIKEIPAEPAENTGQKSTK
jgi:HEAT repeat protein